MTSLFFVPIITKKWMSPLRQLHYFNAPTYIMFASIWEKGTIDNKIGACEMSSM